MIYRVDVGAALPARGGQVDPLGEAIRHQISETNFHVGPIRTMRVFLIDAEASIEQMQRATAELLADPIVESAELFHAGENNHAASRIEIHLKAGVMDPVAASTEMALRDLGINVREVRTGRAYLFEEIIDPATLKTVAERVLANGVIEAVYFEPFVPKQFETGKPYELRIRHVDLTKLTEEQLQRLSRDGHLFLSLAEMRAVQDYFRKQEREPTDVELETIAQTWSEHCVHKTLKSAVDVEVRDESGNVLERRHYGNLIRDTIFQSTQTLMERKPGFCLSVFKDNAGVIAFDETHAVCFKVETHNHPSAIEPYGGSATGVGGVIRDILGTGLAAKPIANTDVFCVAEPGKLRVASCEVRENAGDSPADFQGIHSQLATRNSQLPKGVLHPKRVLQQIVAGVRDYGNRMGIPTVNGAVYFDENYVANPLVFCGCVGLIARDKIEKRTHPGDAIVLLGGRTGRDGIHGATFSSAELTDTHADEFSHAVQIGNAITEKKVADVILQARDLNLFTAVTDCGAGGLSSAVGEMGEVTGATVHLDRVPIKYAGLRYDEIWISEAQERMVLAVPKENVERLLRLARDEDVEATVIGSFSSENRELVLNYQGALVGQLSMEFLHGGIPMPTRRAVIVSNSNPPTALPLQRRGSSFKEHLLARLSHPNIASKHWLIRQYDHEVQGGSVIKPLIGPRQMGPSDAAVIRPKLSSQSGIAIACGFTPNISDPYAMAIASIDEAIRNAVCVGADFKKIAILDNFCWPSVDDELTMGTLVRACEACRDAALAFGIPFISGKDSLHNQFTDKETGRVIRIPNTLLISAIGIVPDVSRCVTMEFKAPGNPVYLISVTNADDLKALAQTHRRVARIIGEGDCAAAHDVSDGGWLLAAAEMSIASGFGVKIDPGESGAGDPFAEGPGRYLLELTAGTGAAGTDLAKIFSPFASVARVGLVQSEAKLAITRDENVVETISIDELTAAWRGTLDW